MNNNFINFIKECNNYSDDPLEIEISSWGRWFLVSVFENINSKFINESVSMGIDTNVNTATYKAMTEFFERKPSKLADKKILNLSKRSDGFAAYPLINNSNLVPQVEARKNALNEAVERFVWATWWDNEWVKFDVLPIDCHELKDDLFLLKQAFNLKDIFEIKIYDSTLEFCLSILVAKNSLNGYISGGACSNNNEVSSRSNRSFGELLRHLIVFERMKPRLNLENLTFYESRLYGYGCGKYSTFLSKKLSNIGSNLIKLNPLEVDLELKTKYSGLITLHRCFFERQPIFMGGAIERFCF